MDQLQQQNHQQEQQVQMAAQAQVSETVFDKRIQTYESLMADVHRKRGNDSEEMLRIKGQLTLVTSILKTQIASEAQELEGQVATLRQAYRDLLSACDHYLEVKWQAKYYLGGEAKRRRKMVMSIREMAESELNCMSGIVKDNVLNKARQEGMLFGNAFSDAIRDYQAAKEDVTKYHGFEEEGDFFNRNVKDSRTDVTDEILVYKKPGEIPAGVQSAVGAVRYAKFLGMEDVIRRSKLVLGKGTDDKYRYGMRVEGLPENHMTVSEIKQSVNNGVCKICYSGEAMKQIANAKLFHMLLGGKNWNPEEDLIMIFSKSETDMQPDFHITGVYLNTRSDAFSTADNTKEITKLLQSKDFVMDERTAASFMTLDANDLDYVIGKGISKEQKVALSKRITVLKNWITATRERESAEGVKQILKTYMWDDPENLKELFGRSKRETKGLYTGLFKNPDFEVEGNTPDMTGERKAYYDIYFSMKKSLDAASSEAKKGMIILTMLDTVPYYQKKLNLDGDTVKDIIGEVSSRLFSENMSDKFLAACIDETQKLRRELVEAYEEVKSRNKKDGSAELTTISENRTLYRDITILERFESVCSSADCLKRDLRHNKMSNLLLDYTSKKSTDVGEDKAKQIVEDKRVVGRLYEALHKESGSALNDELKDQIEDWAGNKFILNPNRAVVDVIEEPIPKLSEEMYSKQVCHAYERLMTLRSFVLPQPPEHTDDQEGRAAERLYKDEMSGMGLTITQAYNQFLEELLAYYKEKPSKEAQILYKRTKIECTVFSNLLTSFISGRKTYRPSTTWNHVIREGVGYSGNITGLKNIGGGTSEVYKIEGKNKTTYFKPDDNIGSSETAIFSGLIDLEVQKAKNNKKLNEDQRAIILAVLESLEDKMKKDYKTHSEKDLYDIYTQPWSYTPTNDMHENTKQFYEKATGKDKKTNEAFWETFNAVPAAYGEKIPEVYHIFPYLHNNAENLPADVLLYLKTMVTNIFTKFTFKLNAYSVATTNAKIAPGSNLSKRNVATSRVSSLLGIDHMVAHSETAYVQKGSQHVFGNLMDEAKGEKIKKVSSFNIYSNAAIQDLNTMLIFDFLMGQCDRHEENITYLTHMEGKKKVIDGIQLIDNDQCGGLLTPKECEAGAGTIEPFDPAALEAVPNAVLRKILELDEKVLAATVGDILNKEEIGAMVKRLDFLKKHIVDFFNKAKTLCESNKPKDKIEGRLLMNDKYKTLLFAKNKHIKSKLAKKLPKEKFIAVTTFALPKLNDIEKELQTMQDDELAKLQKQEA